MKGNAIAIGQVVPKPKDLELYLKPRKFTDKSSISQLFIGDSKVHECFILERPYTGANTRDNPATPGINESEAILPGRYRVTLSWSPGFKQIMLEVLGVPGRSGIRIHVANKPSELLGCLAPGKTAGIDSVISSTDALRDMINKLLPVFLSGAKVYINIERPVIT